MTESKRKPAPKKNPRGRPRVTREVLDARITDYCKSYDVKPGATGLPPFPTGKRESPQHREWLGLYKAHSRLVSRAGVHTEDERREALARQAGCCPACASELKLAESVSHADAAGALRGVLHEECKLTAAAVERLGPDGLDRLKTYLFEATT